eukprot:5554125-Karenia_brevis.AAC.1
MKWVNIGTTNLGGINSRSWGANVQMFHTAGRIDTLIDCRNDCKWVQGARCPMNSEPEDMAPA